MKKGLCLVASVLLLLMFTLTAAAVDVNINQNKDESDAAAVGAEMVLSTVDFKLLSEIEFAEKLDDLRSKYPEYKTADYTYYENGKALAWTCMGYANKCAYYCFGSSQYTASGGWKKSTDKSTFSAGDMVRVNGDTHSIFITYVNGTKIKYTEGNYNSPKQGYNSVVRWDVETTLSNLQSIFTYKWHLTGNNLTGTGLVPENLGNSFYATIVPTSADSLAVSSDGSNVALGTLNYSDSQKWCC